MRSAFGQKALTLHLNLLTAVNVYARSQVVGVNFLPHQVVVAVVGVLRGIAFNAINPRLRLVDC